MRPNTRWTRVRFRLIRLLRRLEILVAPALGALAFGFGVVLAWIVFCLIFLFAVAALPIGLVIGRFFRGRTPQSRDPRLGVFVPGRTPAGAVRNIVRDRRFYARAHPTTQEHP